jgi:hypothetical protein
MSTNKNNSVPPKPDIPPELIQKALDHSMSCDLYDFADTLETARSMWRKFPELVEAPEFPEQLRAAFVKEVGKEPDDACHLAGEGVLDAGYRESLLPRALEMARRWNEEDYDPTAEALK